MYFVRTFTTGAGGSDPRDNTIAVFMCDVCGKDEWVTIPRGTKVSPTEIRRCKKCGAMGKDDHRKSLEVKRDELKVQEELIRAEIEKVISELASLETKPNG
jgi:hypothetical protein